MKNPRKGSGRTFAIVPAYNEEKNIAEVIHRLKKIGIDTIVVDDHSGDNTAAMARANGAKVINLKQNMGKGRAMRAGLDYVLKNHPGAKYIVFIDADMQYDPSYAKKMIDLLKSGRYDFVTGYRQWSNVPFRHKLGNFVWRSTFNTFFGTKFKDTNCGVMALRREAIEKIKDSITGGYIIENSMFVEALNNKLRIEQVPVKVAYRKISGMKRGIKTVGGVLWFIVKKGVSYRLGRK